MRIVIHGISPLCFKLLSAVLRAVTRHLRFQGSVSCTMIMVLFNNLVSGRWQFTRQGIHGPPRRVMYLFYRVILMERGGAKVKPSTKSVTFNIVVIYDGLECGEHTWFYEASSFQIGLFWRLDAAFCAPEVVKGLPQCGPLFMAVMSNMTEAAVSFPFTSAYSIQIYLSN